ncbi:MAG: hypothetical protein IKV25_07555 [Clostridia bacterium]|nr:hypothetical protein [Clostridia bacterium]
MLNLCFIKIDWNAFSAIGSWLGAISTFLAAFIALYPYFKKGKLYFTLHSNIEQCPVLNIVNNKPEGMFIEKICFYAGPTIFNKCFFTDYFFECEDDLVSDKTTNFIEPYSKKQINYVSTRIIHDMEHCGFEIKGFTKKKVRIVVKTNIGKLKINTNIETEYFIQMLIASSPAYSHYDVKDFIKYFCV